MLRPAGQSNQTGADLIAATRISDRSKTRLERIARDTGRSQLEVLDRAIEVYERECFLDALNEGFAALQADPAAWADELAERAMWDATSADISQER